MKKVLFLASVMALTSCSVAKKTDSKPFVWEGANLYFLLTDRFENGDKSNDVNFNRTEKTAKLRGFEGGDIKGITNKINEGYFSDLGVNAIWMTPLVEQIHGFTDEGQGKTYGFHGYWTKDWTNLDPNFGTKDDLREMVESAHSKGIRIVFDVVINHTGPVTGIDPVYPNSWVRTSPQCTYDNYKNTTACTLVANLPDILTEDNSAAELPQMLVDKWKKEGTYEKQVAELEAFFTKYKLPKSPKYYIMKWLSDSIKEYGIDGFRVDTVKHVNEDVWKEFQKICQDAFDEYKKNNPSKVLDDQPFFTVAEVYNYGISQKKEFNFGDKKVNYFENGFSSIINFDFKGDARKSYEEMFAKYSDILHSDLKGYSVMNYAASHDDGEAFDMTRSKPYETATKLLLAPGISQIYYGDETVRPLKIEGVEGDANFRSFMNWEDAKNNSETKKVLAHWQKLGKFRGNHPAVGAGVHKKVDGQNDYWFSRTYKDDKVLVGLDLPKGAKSVNVSTIFDAGTKLRDAYSGKIIVVDKNSVVNLTTDFDIVLFEIVK